MPDIRMPLALPEGIEGFDMFQTSRDTWRAALACQETLHYWGYVTHVKCRVNPGQPSDYVITYWR